MGTWGGGPFDNDAAADFLADAQAAPGPVIREQLQRLARAKAGAYVDADDGQMGWAAAELVALALGQGAGAACGDAVAEVLARFRCKDTHLQLALAAVPRLADAATSELAQLWAESANPAQLQDALAALGQRLCNAKVAATPSAAASAPPAGPRATPAARPKAGDVVVLEGSAGLAVVQVVGASEVAVFQGVYPTLAAALAAIAEAPARRVPSDVARLARVGRPAGSQPLRQDLRGAKRYALECELLDYYVCPASGRGGEMAPYQVAQTLDVHVFWDAASLRAFAEGSPPAHRLRAPQEREADHRRLHAARWAQRRATTDPGPFGDPDLLAALLDWIETYGLDNAILRMHDTATGRQGYGRPNEWEERRCYAFAGLVALWLGSWPASTWPPALAARLPNPPGEPLFGRALEAARGLADQVIAPSAELRLIWQDGDDGGRQLRSTVAALQACLALQEPAGKVR
ncbi:MAG: DUF4259 domain-containing protein [Deltaproteobacteria bacterium]|nr:DUF4259 domain-containing protein [Deltaproteobacteria bacterium]